MYTEEELEYIEKLEKSLKKLSKIKFLHPGNFKSSDLTDLIIYSVTNIRGDVPSTITVGLRNNIGEGGLSSRTIKDIYRIVLYYKPKTKLKEVINIIKELYLNKKISTWICPNINKRVYKYNYNPYLELGIKINGKIKLY